MPDCQHCKMAEKTSATRLPRTILNSTSKSSWAMSPFQSSDENKEPVGDFYPNFRYNEDNSPLQPFQDALSSGGQNTAVNAWDHTGAGGVNYTVDAMPTNYNNSLETTFGTQLPRNTGTPMSMAAGGVDHVTPTGISWGDDKGHFVQPQEGVFATNGTFLSYAIDLTTPATPINDTLGASVRFAASTSGPGTVLGGEPPATSR